MDASHYAFFLLAFGYFCVVNIFDFFPGIKEKSFNLLRNSLILSHLVFKGFFVVVFFFGGSKPVFSLKLIISYAEAIYF